MSSNLPTSPSSRLPRPRSRLAAAAIPESFLLPPQSQVERWENAVSDRILRLDAKAQELGQAFGIPFTRFTLNPQQLPSSNDGLTVAVAILERFAHRDERVSLERRGGRWGLFFAREPAALAQERKIETVPLKDAPLDVRERFLLRSDEFFGEYLELCHDRLGRMKESVSKGDETLSRLPAVVAS